MDKLTVNKVKSPLLFGKAIDNALNYVLKQKKNNKKIRIDYVNKLFRKTMSEWDGSVEFVFFKSEIPPEQFIKGDNKGNQQRAWEHLNMMGIRILDTYIKEVLPLIKNVVEIQTRKTVTNDDGDEFTMILDAIVELMDGRVVLLDHKTASKPYPKDAVETSVQLAAYNEHWPVPYAGYLVMEKKLVNEAVVWNLLVGIIPDEKKEQVFQDIGTVMDGIKAGKFEKNEKSCFSYGKMCDYYLDCRHGNSKGLVKKP